MQHPNSLKNLENGKATQFKPGQSGNPRGGKPKLLSGLIAELSEAGYERVNKSNVIEAIEYLFSLSEAEVREIAQDETLPIYIKIVAKRLLTTKGFEALEVLTDRAHGRPTQPVEANVSNNSELELLKSIIANGKPDQPLPTQPPTD